MAEESKQAQTASQTATEQTAPKAETKLASRIPMTSVAVMIFILLVAFVCIGVQVVTGVVEAKNAPVEIKGKSATQLTEYPVLAPLDKGVAAEVNGVEIPEEQITGFIMEMRSNLGLEDQEAWDEWLIEGSNTTEALRNQVILSYVNNEVINQLAEEMGIEPTKEDIDALREQLYSDPEQKASLEAMLAAEGRTLDDYEDDLVVLTKRKLIGRAENAALQATPEFKEAILIVIQERYPEYADAQSLDEVDPAVVESVTDELAELNENKAFADRVHEFLEESDIYYSEMDSDVPYKSGADAYFMKEEFKYLLNKNGLFLGEGGLFDNLMANGEEGSES